MEYHARKLESNEESRQKPEVEEMPEERKAKAPRREEGASEAQGPFRENEAHTPSSSSQPSSGSKAKTKFEKKKREVKTRVGDAIGSEPEGISPTPVEVQPPAPVIPVASKVYRLPSGGTVRLRPRGPEDGEDQGPESRPSKSQRVDDDDLLGLELMEALDEAESSTIHLTSLDRCMPLITCDAPIDVSFLGSDYARDLSEAIACTRVGEVRRALGERVADCMMAELCEDDKANADPVGASIFDHDSSIGLGLDETVDRWVHDVAAGTWTDNSGSSKDYVPPK